MQAFILAGGFATRLWPLTEKRAKPLLPLAGKPILSYLVESIPGDTPITVSTNAVLAGGFEEWQKTLDRSDVSILIEDTGHDDQKLGALGAVAQWITEQHIEDDVLLLTGDNYCGFDMQQFIKTARPETALLAAHDIGSKEAAKAFGTVIVGTDQKTIEAFEEKPQEPKTSLVSTGFSFLPASALPILVEFAKAHPDNVGGIFEELLRQGKSVDCFIFEEPWFDIGSFESYLEATKAFVGEKMLVDETSTMENTQCQGTVVLGKNTQVKNCELDNVVIFEDCTIEDCVLRDCIIDNHCSLSGIDLTGKMLRTETVLTQN
jgi:glucose-1-phosphate thymidylyltransferase|tara:strand:- start:601 stop:1557 length:957 start_codon:yes stop_codon:yes gene_type:complete